MQILDGLLILLLIVLAFSAGLLVAGNYYNKLLAHHEYTEKIMAAQKGLGYIAVPEAKRRQVIGDQFMDKLRTEGRAVQAIRTPRS